MIPYVASIHKCTISIAAVIDDVPALTRAYGGVHDVAEEMIHIQCADDNEMLKVLQRMMNNGMLFSYGTKGWEPSDVVWFHREAGRLQGSFREIYWTGPGKYGIRER